jgi:flagellin-like hook-associated protein FlgL
VFTSATTGEDSQVEISNIVETGVDAADLGIAAADESGEDATFRARTVDELVSAVNATTALQGFVRASNDNGRLRVENISTAELTVGGLSTTGEVTGGAEEGEIGGNTVRTNLVKQFNELRDQLNKLADDASFNGVNLLRGDLLKLTFNETGTSTIEIQAKDEDGEERAINSATLGISTAENSDFDTDVAIDSLLDELSGSLGVLRSQSSAFGSNLSIVENRTEFTKAMMNTLQTGADKLVLADTNEEAANMLALQTRQQLSSTALSLASQADQAVLRLF